MTRGYPRAREGLVTEDHSRRGRRCVTVLDPDALKVTVLEAWEHAVLLLCDGTRDPGTIAELMGPADGASGDEASVRAAIEFFARENLVLVERQRASPRFASAGPQTRAQLLSAYDEWHKEAPSTGARAAPDSPFGEAGPPAMKPGLGPTVALSGGEDDDAPRHRVGSVLVAAAVEPSAPVHGDGAHEPGDAPPEGAAGTAVGRMVPEPAPTGPWGPAEVGGAASATEELEARSPVEPEDPDESDLGEEPTFDHRAAGRGFSGEAKRFARQGRRPTLDRAATQLAGGAPGVSAVFARLRAAGVRPRGEAQPRRGGRGRRRDVSSADRFEEGLAHLERGDLAFALRHFRSLARRMPDSRRVQAFVRAIEDVALHTEDRMEDTAPIELNELRARALSGLDSALDEAMRHGRCPSCFTEVAAGARLCPHCGFSL